MSIKQKSLFCTFIITAFLTTTLSVFAHEWTATSGHKLSGEFIKLEGGVVSIELSDGKIADIPFDKLCDTDKNFVQQETAKKENPFVILEDKKPTTTAQNVQKYDWRTPLNELQTAAAKGNAEACLELSERYSLGTGFCSESIEKRNEWLKKGAKEDSPAGWVCLAKCYDFEVEEKIDKTKISNLITKISQSKYVPAQLFLALRHYQNNDKENNKKAFDIFHHLAEQGNVKAQILLAGCYLEGKGTAKNEKTAFDWTLKSAEQGFSSGQMMVGAFYIEGDVVAKDIKKGVEWQIKAAEQGNLLATLMVAGNYLGGIGVEKDLEKAKIWAKKAIAQGAEEYGKLVLQQIEQNDAAGDIQQSTNTLKETKKVFVKGHFEGISQDGKWIFYTGDNNIYGVQLSNGQNFSYKVADNKFLGFVESKISTDGKYAQIEYSVAAGKRNEPLADIKQVTIYATGNNAGKNAKIKTKYLNTISTGQKKNSYTGNVYYQDASNVVSVEVDKDGKIFTIYMYGQN
ncbi:MAG: sel1 repeat family protein [Planctomycetaceae bacterium]|jgi:TPR repeat protein|nr:sel1 repeat family protein [Planctomycetaceae bacterium]